MDEEKVKSRPQDKWDAKAGMISKSYKVKKEAADAFAAACKKQGVSIGIKLSELMSEYANSHK